MYKICFYVPKSSLEEVKSALFEAGAGTVGGYQHCAWQTLGQGQFMPLAHSNPHIGAHNQLETIDEYKVELVCEDAFIEKAIVALKDSHPYETPAFQVFKIEEINA